MQKQQDRSKTLMKWIYGMLYLLSILIGNILVIKLGIVHWYYLQFPAGTIFVGLTFSFRDLAQQYWGDYKIWTFMLMATTITFLLNKQVATASVMSFILSETVDWSVFTKFKNKTILWRIIVSNTISTPIDSTLFIVTAFGSFIWPAIFGQAIIKYLSSLFVVPILWNSLGDKK